MMITTKTCAFLKEILHKNVIFIKIHSFHWHGCGLLFQWDKLFSRKIYELTSWSLPLFLKFCKRFTFGSRDVIFFEFFPFVCVFSAMYLLPIEPNIFFKFSQIILRIFLFLNTIFFLVGLVSKKSQINWNRIRRKKNDTATATIDEPTNEWTTKRM